MFRLLFEGGAHVAKSVVIVAASLAVLALTGCAVTAVVPNSTTKSVSNIMHTSSTHETAKYVTTAQRLNQKDLVGEHQFDHADSVWRVSRADSRTGQASDYYISSYMGTGSNGAITHPKQPVIIVLGGPLVPRDPGFVNYPCPRSIGYLAITSVTDAGVLVHFVSSQNVGGTLNLATHQWHFVSK